MCVTVNERNDSKIRTIKLYLYTTDWLLLLLLITSAPARLQNSRNLVHRFQPISIYTMCKGQRSLEPWLRPIARSVTKGYSQRLTWQTSSSHLELSQPSSYLHAPTQYASKSRIRNRSLKFQNIIFSSSLSFFLFPICAFLYRDWLKGGPL